LENVLGILTVSFAMGTWLLTVTFSLGKQAGRLDKLTETFVSIDNKLSIVAAHSNELAAIHERHRLEDQQM
jgi:hypothetical protein